MYYISQHRRQKEACRRDTTLNFKLNPDMEKVIGAEDEMQMRRWCVGEEELESLLFHKEQERQALSEQMTACTDLSGVCWAAPWRGEVEAALTCVSDSEPFLRSAHTHDCPASLMSHTLWSRAQTTPASSRGSEWDAQHGLSLLGAAPQAIPPLLELNLLDL
ncbi:hypothetical protein QQF64_031334 [Cirrhinus molitorella]|uniref:Uncharacterized protein n=1 Tax=Cirrhinus molitorella TaxID=172907 RepID=A0ABR3MWM2_9TELE